MTPVPDPFAHHPELRDKIADPLQSWLRTITREKMVAKMQELGLPSDWFYSNSEREAKREQALADRRDADLWVFGYGSLMWDPALRFAEVRRAYVPDYARRFILKDTHGARGSAEAPGLMAALDSGPGCDGLAFRIAREDIDGETEILWRREGIAPAYLPVFVDTVISGAPVSALTFVADHDAAVIDAGLTRTEQIRYFATGTGFLGTSLEYLRNIADHFTALGIEDEEVSVLLSQTESYMRSR